MSLRFLSLLTAVSFLVLCASCQTPKSTADSQSNGVMQKQPDNSHDVHGEVGVGYGSGTSRR